MRPQKVVMGRNSADMTNGSCTTPESALRVLEVKLNYEILWVLFIFSITANYSKPIYNSLMTGLILHLWAVRLQDSGSISLGDKDGIGRERARQAREGSCQQDRVWETHFPEGRNVPWDKHLHKSGRQEKAQWIPGNKNVL